MKPEFKHKLGDFVRIGNTAFGFNPDVVYEIVGFTTNHPLIKSTDPTKPISPEICIFDPPGSTEYYDHQLELDKDYMTKKLGELFG